MHKNNFRAAKTTHANASELFFVLFFSGTLFRDVVNLSCASGVCVFVRIARV